jgi:hypothetical protein
MKLRNLIVAIIVLGALTGALYWSNNHKPSDDTANKTDDAPSILKLDQSSITKVELKNRDEAPTVLEKNNFGAWQITAPKLYSADPSNVASTLSSIASLNAQRVVEDKPADLKPYGLAPPNVEINVTEKDNKSHKLLLGDDSPTGNTVYAMLAGDPRVFTIASFNKSSIDKSLNELRDRRLLQVNVDQVSRIELVQKNQTIEFDRGKQDWNKDDWQILRPTPARADANQISQLLQKLTDAKMDLFEANSNPKDAEKAFASGTPVATVKVTNPAGTQQIQVRKDKDADYAKSSAVEGVHKVNADLADWINKGVEDFRNKKIFDFGFDDPEKIEIHSGAKTASLARNGDIWSQAGKKMDGDTVQSLVSNLRFIAADKFVDSGFANPGIEATVTSEGGKRVEKVAFAKSSDGYLAKRENDPTLYHLQSASVEAVQTAFDGLKPAAK